MPPFHASKRNTGDDYDRLDEVLLDALHALYESFSFGDMRELYLEVSRKRVMPPDIGERLARETERLRKLYTINLASAKLWPGIRSRIEGWVPVEELKRVIEETTDSRMAATIHQVRQILIDRLRHHPTDRLEEVLKDVKLDRNEHLRNYLSLQAVPRKDLSQISFEYEDLTQRVNQPRHLLHQMIMGSGHSRQAAEVLLCRLEYLADAAYLKAKHPVLFKEWIRSQG